MIENSINTLFWEEEYLVSNEDIEAWKKYIDSLEDQDSRDLYHAIAYLKDEFTLYRGISPSNRPAYLFKTIGRCRLKLNFSTDLTEISFNAMCISKNDLVEFLKCFSEL